MSRDPRDLVAELRAEAVKDGDPLSSLGWEAADTIDALLALLATAEADADRLALFVRCNQSRNRSDLVEADRIRRLRLHAEARREQS